MIATIWQAIRFALVGIANTGLGLLTMYAIMYFFRLGPLAANALGYTIGLALSFALNRKWTFRNNSSIQQVLLRYILAAALSYTFNFITILIFYHLFKTNPYLIQLLGIAPYTASMFLMSKFFVFPQPKRMAVAQ
ncbi:GtrA family protein (plasmid) [Rhizobium sp. CB3171]|uniref:GtrA family protein n=1 Tax=Rhizobium sp. CB3171 TaxID=3039157 RepID=UPI0024B1876B|nr:GtrA family protein [Rhizobium sp. CB3171]WFU05929.1 GtrA family protein [Rhizobium sp. CB3171]